MISAQVTDAESQSEATMDLHTYILDTFYWPYIDRGQLPEQTPLIRHHMGIGDLTYHIASTTGASLSQIDRALRTAVLEVEL